VREPAGVGAAGRGAHAEAELRAPDELEEGGRRAAVGGRLQDQRAVAPSADAPRRSTSVKASVVKTGSIL
jgi:hypothetical protein